MLWSTELELDGKKYVIKLGMKQIIQLQKENIDISEVNGNNFESMLKMLHISMINNGMTFEELVDKIDNDGKVTLKEISKVLKTAIDLGVWKKNIIDSNDDDIEKKVTG